MKHECQGRFAIEAPGVSTEKITKEIVPFYEQRREKQYAETDSDGAEQPLDPGSLKPRKLVFQEQGKAGEIQREQPAEHSQHQIER